MEQVQKNVRGAINIRIIHGILELKIVSKKLKIKFVKAVNA